MATQWKKIWSKRYSVRLGENWSYGALKFREHFEVAFPAQRIIIKDGFGYGFVQSDEYEQTQAQIRNSILTDGFDVYVGKKAEKVFTNFLIYAKEIGQTDFSGYTNQELAKAHSDFILKEDDWMAYVWMIFLLDDCLSAILQHAVREKYGTEYNRVLEAIIAPEKKTAAANERREILELAGAIERGMDTAELEVRFQNLADRYGYFSTLNMDEVPLTAAYFKTELETAVREYSNPAEIIQTETQKDTELQSFYRRICEENTQDTSFLRLVHAAKQVAFYREYRNDVRQESYFHVRPLYSEIARRLGISLADIIFMTRHEIQDSLGKGQCTVSQSSPAERRQWSALFSSDAGVAYDFDAARVKEIFEAMNEEMAQSDHDVRGIAAYPGRVQGRVCKVFDVRVDAEKFCDGDILVATTTNLAFIPLLHKAGAIVTDEGGLLTHTAIVARELKKPCVVGTKMATQVFQDGDVIEVDAEQGIVWKL